MFTIIIYRGAKSVFFSDWHFILPIQIGSISTRFLNFLICLLFYQMML
ncbi:unnamed protein product [Brugia timori]|uniref:Uncharacterized protein n=1 Tax=Brugia timori TaxID=42155 RepID=A0A0R3QES3_9BILA|nr:unnamed protein product [Brugia timori]